MTNSEPQTTKATTPGKKSNLDTERSFATPWEQKEWQEFTAQKLAFHRNNPELGPAGSAARLGAEFSLTAPVVRLMSELKELAAEKDTGLAITEHGEDTCLYVTDDKRHPDAMSAGIKIAQMVLANRSQTYYDGSGLQMSLKDPVDLVRSFVVEQFVTNQEEGHADFTLVGPGVVLLDDAKVDPKFQNDSAWNDLQAYLKAHPDFTQSERDSGTKETVLIAVDDSFKKSLLRETDTQAAVVKRIRSYFRDDCLPEKMTVLFLEPGSYLEHFFTAAHSVVEVLGALQANPQIAELQWHVPIVHDYSQSRLENSHLTDQALSDRSQVIVTIRGAEAFDALIEDLEASTYTSSYHRFVDVQLEEQVLVDRSGARNHVRFRKGTD